jgi:two-component system LytT family response regulator
MNFSQSPETIGSKPIENEIRAIIVDDEPNARVVLKQLLSKSNHNIKVLAECSNLIDAVDKIQELKPTAVFLDVQMPKYAGYEIVKFFDQIDFEIIFVTAFDEYALKAFEMNAMDYLVKPIERERLNKTIEKIQESMEVQRQTKEYEYLLRSMQTKKSQKLIIPELGNRRIVEIADIKVIEANGSYTTFYMNETDNFVASKNLKYFEKRIGEDSRFFRSHRAFIVNLDFVNGLNKKELVLKMEGGRDAKIARSRIDVFEKMMF